MKFNQQKKKIRSLWERVELSQNETEDLKRISIRMNPVAFTKKIVRIELLNEYAFSKHVSGGGPAG